MDKQPLLSSLSKVCCIARDSYGCEEAYALSFAYESVVVSLRITFSDWESDAELVFFNITTLPDEMRSLGHGSSAVQTVLTHAKKHGYQNIIATLVDDAAEGFWTKNGFECVDHELNDFQLKEQ